MLPSPILALFAHISKPLWLNIRSTGAEVTGRQKTFSSNGCSSLNASLSQVPRPRPGPRLEGSKTKTALPRLRGSRPRPRLVKTGLEMSRDQDSSLENSKSGLTLFFLKRVTTFFSRRPLKSKDRFSYRLVNTHTLSAFKRR